MAQAAGFVGRSHRNGLVWPEGPAAHLAVFGWVLLVVLSIQLFWFYNWEEGRIRFIVLLILGGLSFGLPPLFLRPKRSVSSNTWISIACFAVIVVHVVIHVFFVYTSITTRRDMGDQGEINYRAIRLLEQGINPYGVRTYLDIVRYEELINEPGNRQCLLEQPENLERRFQAFWTSVSARDLERASPSISQASSCEPIRRELDTMGFKYGPFLLLSYFPFVTMLGSNGIYIAHLLILAAICMALFWKEIAIKRSVVFVASIPLFVVLGPTILRFSTLRRADSDLLPTLLVLLSVLYLERKWDRLAAVSLGLSIAAKLLPGLLFVPLLLGARRHAWFYLLSLVCLVWVPFAVWEWRGFSANVLWFNVARGADSTSLAYYLPEWAQRLLLLPFGLVTLLMVVRMHRQGWQEGPRLAYSVAVLLLLFGSARIFHNNYLVWLLPFLGLWLSFNTRIFFSAPGGSGGSTSRFRNIAARSG